MSGISLIDDEQWEEDRVKFGLHLKDLRVKKGLTQAALGELLNSDENYIRKIELGSRSPSYRTITNLALALEISRSELVDY